MGEKNATAAKHIRYAYSYDMSFVKPKLPDYVVMAETVEQIQELMRFANREKIPVIPYTAGTNIGGLCIPERGGILLDLKRMNKIIKIDPESHYAVIEPGVSHGQLAEALLCSQTALRLARGTAIRIGFLVRHQPRHRGSECPLRAQQPGDYEHGSRASHGRTGARRIMRHR